MILIKQSIQAIKGLSVSIKRGQITTSSGFRLPKMLTTITLILLIQSCTNSKLIISPLYNRLDDRMRSKFNEIGDFNDEQTEAFAQRVGTFHVWHRQSEYRMYKPPITTKPPYKKSLFQAIFINELAAMTCP